MCEPITALGLTTASQTMFASSLAISALGAVSGYVGQMQQANAQASYQAQMANQQNKLIIENSKAANAAFVEQAAAENIATGQRQEAAAQEIQELSRERLRAQGTAQASSEASGLSVEMLMADFLREEGRYRDSVQRQLEFDADESQRRIAGFRAQAVDRGRSVQPYTPEPIQQPSIFGAGLQIAGAGFDAYTRFATKDPVTKSYRLGE